jgi:cytochrome c-type biogenesis protein CcmH
MFKNRLLTLAVSLLLVMALASTAMAEVDTKPIESQLICQCGCNMVVATCDCATAGQVRAEIAKMMGEGKTAKEILQFYVDKYGEVVLAAPTKTGFNLTAWITPFAAVLAGGALLYFLLRRWVLKYRQNEEENPVANVAAEEEADQRYLQQVDKVLKEHF